MPSHITPHPRKRQFQPDITSYFAFRPRDTSTTEYSSQRRTEPQSQLSEAIQSSLITVGMRVRKAVPEGYPHLKAAVAHKAYQPYAQSSIPTSTYAQPPKWQHTRSQQQRQYQQRELQPLCGIHRVGGLSAQSNAHDSYEEDGWDDLGASSQESFASSVSTDSTHDISNHLKRGYDEEADEDDYACSFRLDGDGQTPVFEFGVPLQKSQVERRIAKPTTRNKRAIINPLRHVESVDDFDFGEAPFLRFGQDDEVDMDLD